MFLRNALERENQLSWQIKMQSTICFLSEMKMPVEILALMSCREKNHPTNQNNELNPGVSVANPKVQITTTSRGNHLRLMQLC